MNKVQRQLIAQYTDEGTWEAAVGSAETMVFNMLLEREGGDEMLMVKVLEKQVDFIAQALAREIMVNRRKLFGWGRKKVRRELDDFRWTIQLLQWHAFRHVLEGGLPTAADEG